MNNHIMFKLVLALTIFGLCSASYSQSLGQKLCMLTVASYCNPAKIQNWSCPPCKASPLVMTNVHTFVNSSMDTLGFIATSTDLHSIVLVFRGTLPWDVKNWISDINFLMTNYPLCNNKCKVHQGFFYAFSDIKKQVLDTVAQYQQKYGMSNVIVTGHSLGAALATHAAAHLLANKVKVTELYTFGSPRVGDPNFTVWFNQIFGKDHFKARITHCRDPVPHLPILAQGFQHINTQIFYKGALKQGATVCKDDQKEDNNCSDQFYVDYSIPDHLSYFDIDFSSNILKCQN